MLRLVNGPEQPEPRPEPPTEKAHPYLEELRTEGRSAKGYVNPRCLAVPETDFVTLQAIRKLKGRQVIPLAFQETFAPDFKRDNPQLGFKVINRPSKHPYFEAIYRNGRQRVVGIKNQTEEEILRVAHLLRSTKGKKPTLHLPRHQTPLVHAPGSTEPRRAANSIQGKWFPGMFPPVHEMRKQSDESDKL